MKRSLLTAISVLWLSGNALANVVADCSSRVETAYSTCLNTASAEPVCRQSAYNEFGNCLGVNTTIPGQTCTETLREDCDTPIPVSVPNEIVMGDGLCYKSTQVEQSCRYFDKCGRVSTYSKHNLVSSSNYVCGNPAAQCSKDSHCGTAGSRFCNVAAGRCEYCQWHQTAFTRNDDTNYWPGCMCAGDTSWIGDQIIRMTVGRYKNSCTGEEAVGRNFAGNFCSHETGDVSFRCWSTGGDYPLNLQDIPSNQFTKN